MTIPILSLVKGLRERFFSGAMSQSINCRGLFNGLKSKRMRGSYGNKNGQLEYH